MSGGPASRSGGGDIQTVVLDDDPTGSQSAQGVEVVLDPRSGGVGRAVRSGRSVYVLTNTRAVDEVQATSLVRAVRDEIREAAGARRVRIVLRGDSTLRGHVFAESEAVADDQRSVIVFVPAFPAGGRTTIDGIHRVSIDGRAVPAAETEFARDPVFPFRSSGLADYVREKSARTPIPVPLEVVRSDALAEVIASAPDGAVIVPDVETDEDIRWIASAVRVAERVRPVIVRCAAPLAAALAGVASAGLLEDALRGEAPMLLAVGSHTAAATAQLARIEPVPPAVVLGTERALADPEAEGRRAAAAARAELTGGDLVVVASERIRRADDGTLDDGAHVMTALTTAVRELAPHVRTVIAKGGITSADVATRGLGATAAWVVGQLEPGVSLWRIALRDGRDMDYIVVPGNVGDDDLLDRLVARARRASGTSIGGAA